MGRRRISFMMSAVSNTLRISPAEKSSRSRTCWRWNGSRATWSSGISPAISGLLYAPPTASAIANLLSVPGQQNLIHPIDLQQVDVHILFSRGGQVLSHEIGPDWKLPMATIHQHHQPDHPGAAVVDQSIHGGAYRPPGVEDIVHQHDPLASDIDRYVGWANRQRPAGVHVVPVQSDIQLPHRDRCGLELLDARRDPLR